MKAVEITDRLGTEREGSLASQAGFRKTMRNNVLEYRGKLTNL